MNINLLIKTIGIKKKRKKKPAGFKWTVWYLAASHWGKSQQRETSSYHIYNGKGRGIMLQEPSKSRLQDLMSFIISPMRLFYLSASNSPMFYDAVLCVSVDSCSTFGCIVPNYTASMHHFRYNVIHDNIEPSSQLPNNFPYLLKNILYF